MAEHGQIAETWWHKPPPLPNQGRRVMVPDPYSIVAMEVMWTYYDVLVLEHQENEKAASRARDECRKAADTLRQCFDNHAEVGPEAADAMIAWQCKYARKNFARDLSFGKWWRVPGTPRKYR